MEEGLKAEPPTPGSPPCPPQFLRPAWAVWREGTQKSAGPLGDLPCHSVKPGEYIYALKDLTFATFCGAISEKFCDLYWGEKLLQNLFKVVNGRTSPLEK